MEECEKDAESLLMDSQNIRTVYEVIKFMDEMPGGFLIYRANEAEDIVYANKALLRIFQCSTLKEFREMTGNSFRGLVYLEDLDEIEESIKEQIAASQYDLDYVEYRIVRRDGEIRWIEDYGHFIRSETVGDIFYVFLGDATEKRSRQLQILERALNNANLAIQAKNKFLSNMSHDIRTPLNAITGFTSLAKNHIDNRDEVQRYLDKIGEASGQLLDLVDKVLEISWTETKDVHVEEAECNLREILQSVERALSPRFSGKKITFETDLTGVKHLDVYSDRDKLRQIVQYLAGNAVEYTGKGGRVRVAVVEGEQLANDYAVYRLVVSDNGIGISKEFQEHVFEPFERENNTTFSGIYGTGLGLAITRNIVKIMGGTIEVDSAIGKGSTFTVTIRLRIQETQLVSAVSPEDVAVCLNSGKILLVEDNEINVEIETEILEKAGFCIEIAENGSIAVEKVKKSEPGEYALVLMDIQMPVMDGREAAEAIRGLGNPELAHIPIIALSADAFENDRRLSLESGMDEHLTKPMDIDEVVGAMAKALQRHKTLYGDR
ncbi:PAS domain-containing hybrid sensor histidine kinase/response regulator [Hominisplanchenecus murintestinalis]|uniref:PAS domain-containing hybrid sensor histidine kinase/response regulator n=2 Tax=Hominisplanchenecus murintestinalis TaxID=2941517 RepID=A0AC61R3Q3_9FIRM|nr:PAS domain-containing hybrid sensor histidine kinase/response regulator [Hominisplanchenecus murintestinalis]